MLRSLALFALVLAVGVSVPPVPVTISELIAHPADHYDQRLQVSGVLKSTTFGPHLCELPSRATAPPADAPWDRPCIDIATSNWPFPFFDFSKRGALITIVGYFSFTCPDPKTPNEDGVQVMCVDRGWNGYINVESVAIGGYATCEDDECAPEDTSGAHEVASSDPGAQGIDGFARALVSAARSRSADRVVAITLPSLRTETRFTLEDRSSFARYYGEMANAPDWLTERGKGYRLFDIEKTDYTARHHELCFCIKGDCAGRWSQATADRYGANFSCHYVWRDGGAWYLLY